MDEKVEVPYDDELSELVEQFTRECQTGSDPDIEDYVRRHPELGEDIRRIFPSLQFLQRAGLGKLPGDAPQESAFSSDPIRALVLGRLARELERTLDDLGELASRAVSAVLDEPEIAAEEREAAQLTHALPQGDPLAAVLSVRIERALRAGRKAAAEEDGTEESQTSFAVLLLRQRGDDVGEETCVGLAVAQIEERLLAALGTPTGSSSFMVLADGASLALLREKLADQVGDSPAQVAFISRPKLGQAGPPAEIEVVPIEHEIDGLESRLGRKLSTALGVDGSSAEGKEAPQDDPLIGTLFHNKYRILRGIGSGGFGTVYEARDERGAGNRVAIKVLRADRARHPALLKAFRAEARRVTRLSHANVVDWKVFDQTEDGVEYFVMELVAGEELDKVLRREKRLAPDRVANIMLGVLDALRAAHNLSETESILHLDLKPHNVFVIPGRAGRPERIKVIDFGIGQYVGGEDEGAALAAERDESMIVPSGLLEDLQELPQIEGEPFNPATITFGRQQSLHVDAGGVRFQRSIACTPEYASPEQTTHVLEKDDIEPLDGRSDIFSLGVMSYLMLTGELPFERSYSRLMMLQQRLEVDARTVASTGVKVPRALARFVERCLKRDRDQRFADAGEAFDALDKIVHPPVARVVAKVVIPVVALAALAVVVVWQGQERERFVPLPNPNAYLGPFRPEAVFQPTDEEDRELIAEAAGWILVDAEDGEPLLGWEVNSRQGSLVVTGPKGKKGRVQVKARPQSSNANLTVRDLTLTWLGAESWSFEPPTFGGEELGERSVAPSGIELEVVVVGQGHGDLQSVTVAVDGGDPQILASAENADSTRFYRDLGGLGLDAGRASLELVLVDRAERRETRQLALRLVAGSLGVQARLVDGPDTEVECNQLGTLYCLTRNSRPHLLLTASRRANFRWSVELDGSEKGLSGEGDLGEDFTSRIPLELKTLEDGSFTGRIVIPLDENPYVLHATPGLGEDSVTLSFRYIPDAADAVLSLETDGSLLEFPSQETLYVQRRDLACVIRRVGDTAVDVRTVLSWRRPTDEAFVEHVVVDLGQKRTIRQTVALPGDGRWILRLDVEPLDPQGKPAGRAESTHLYEICVDDRPPQIRFEGLEGTPILRNSGDMNTKLLVGLLPDEGGQGSTMQSLGWTLLDGLGKPIGTGDFTSVFPEGFHMPWPLSALWESTPLPDGVYELVVEARDKSGNAATSVHRPFEVALTGPALTLDKPRGSGREWDEGSQGWRVEVVAFDRNGVEEVTVEILLSENGPVLQHKTLTLEQGEAPFEYVAVGNVDFDHEHSGKVVWVRLSGRDGRGNISRVIAVERTLGSIAATIHTRIVVAHLDRPATASMSLIEGNGATIYVFGGRAVVLEDRAFRDAGLVRWPRRQEIWAIEYRSGEIEDFYLDQREVTRGEFLTFVQGGVDGYLDPRVWPAGSQPPDEARRTVLEQELSGGNSDVAVTDVTWEEASAFATWIGKRLPSWVEWEYVVREGASYHVWAGQTASNPKVPAGRGTVPASAPRSSGSGRDITEKTRIRDLSGNVSEWTSSPMSYDDESDSVNRKDHLKVYRRELLAPAGHQNAQKFWIAGGSFEIEKFDFTAGENRDRRWKAPHVGFRCAFSFDAAQEGLTSGTVQTEEEGRESADDQR